jgi:predicted NUDIX family NTP pyrophosphohydrolase
MAADEARCGAGGGPADLLTTHRVGVIVAKQPKESAGLLLFRRTGGAVEVFLAHPGGPFWARRDAGAWSLPKGLLDEGEDPLAAARREFEEETSIRPAGPFLPLGSVRQKAGKTVHAWACEGDADPALVKSNDATVEWPRGSGRLLTFPEVDRCAWFDLPTAREKIIPAQAEFLDRLEVELAGGKPPAGA